VGSLGRVYRTTDAGASWSLTPIATSNWLEDVSFVDQVGYTVGRSGVISRSDDGGVSWSAPIQPCAGFYDIFGVVITPGGFFNYSSSLNVH
jgi:photosystem II stability/assembly factor-like uncharacterized protein